MNRTGGFLTAVFLGMVVFFGGCSAGYSPGSTAIDAPLTEGQKFTLKDLNGQSVSLSGLLTKKKAVLVNFWATWCPYCVEEIPDLVKLKEKYKDSPFEILGLNVGETAEQASPYVKRLKINYPVLLDTDNGVAENYRVVGIPTTYLVSAEGKIIGEYHSFSRELQSDVERALK